MRLRGQGQPANPVLLTGNVCEPGHAIGLAGSGPARAIFLEAGSSDVILAIRPLTGSVETCVATLLTTVHERLIFGHHRPRDDLRHHQAPRMTACEAPLQGSSYTH